MRLLVVVCDVNPSYEEGAAAAALLRCLAGPHEVFAFGSRSLNASDTGEVSSWVECPALTGEDLDAQMVASVMNLSPHGIIVTGEATEALRRAGALSDLGRPMLLDAPLTADEVDALAADCPSVACSVLPYDVGAGPRSRVIPLAVDAEALPKESQPLDGSPEGLALGCIGVNQADLPLPTLIQAVCHEATSDWRLKMSMQPDMGPWELHGLAEALGDGSSVDRWSPETDAWPELILWVPQARSNGYAALRGMALGRTVLNVVSGEVLCAPDDVPRALERSVADGGIAWPGVEQLRSWIDAARRRPAPDAEPVVGEAPDRWRAWTAAWQETISEAIDGPAPRTADCLISLCGTDRSTVEAHHDAEPVVSIIGALARDAQEPSWMTSVSDLAGLPYEIVWVEDGGCGAARAARSHASADAVRVVTVASAGLLTDGAAWQAGAQVSSGEVLCFMPREGAIAGDTRALVEAARRPEVGVVAASRRDSHPCSLDDEPEGHGGPSGRAGLRFHAATPCFATRRDVFDLAGPFDPTAGDWAHVDYCWHCLFDHGLEIVELASLSYDGPPMPDAVPESLAGAWRFDDPSPDCRNQLVRRIQETRPEYHATIINDRWGPVRGKPEVPLLVRRDTGDTARSILAVITWTLGDVLMATPALRGLVEAYPDSEVTCLCHPAYAPALAGNDTVAAVCGDEATLGQSSFDLVINLDPRTDEFGEKHPCEYFCDLARVEPDSLRLAYHVSEEDRQWAAEAVAREFPDDVEKLVGLHLYTPNSGTRNWPLERFWDLSQDLVDRHSAAGLILLGGRGEEVHTRSWSEDRTGARTFNAVGQTTIGQLAALVERCDLIVCPDSGPMHLAGAVGTPFVALFGPVDEDLRFPPGADGSVLACRPCQSGPCRRDRCEWTEHSVGCMESIDVRSVMVAIERRLVGRCSTTYVVDSVGCSRVAGGVMPLIREAGMDESVEVVALVDRGPDEIPGALSAACGSVVQIGPHASWSARWNRGVAEAVGNRVALWFAPAASPDDASWLRATLADADPSKPLLAARDATDALRIIAPGERAQGDAEGGWSPVLLSVPRTRFLESGALDVRLAPRRAVAALWDALHCSADG